MDDKIDEKEEKERFKVRVYMDFSRKKTSDLL